jgi:cytochrome c oxidase subunit 2
MKQNIVNQTDTTFLFIIGVSVVLLLGITTVMIYFVIRYNKKRNPVPTSTSTGNTLLEILWTVIPTILVLVMFFFGYSGFKYMRNAPSDAMIVKATGRMWQWTYEYENGKKSDTLFVLLNKPVKMEIMSVDVNHSFYLPAFRVKEDAIPGRINHLWFQPEQEGNYVIECAEYCGLSHSYMLSSCVVLSADKFNVWYNEKPKVDSVKTNDTLKTNQNIKDTIKIK